MDRAVRPGAVSEFRICDTWNVMRGGKPGDASYSRRHRQRVIRHLNRTPEQRIYSITAGED